MPESEQIRKAGEVTHKEIAEAKDWASLHFDMTCDDPETVMEGYHAMVLAIALTQCEANRGRLLVWLREIADLDPQKLYAGYDAVRLAQSARKEVGDED
jgi:hypothetical protein